MSLKQISKNLVPSFIFNVYHWVRAAVAAMLYMFPARGMQVFGITGTNGKTTTSLFLYEILQAARRKTGLATTVRFSDGKSVWRNEVKMTTLDPFGLQRLIASMRKNRAVALVMEVTSHALIQNRVLGINFDTVVFTNLTHDHLDFHKTREAYQRAKELLFAKSHRVSVVNLDDPASKYFLHYNATRKLTYSTKNSKANVYATTIRHKNFASSFVLNYQNQSVEIDLKVGGEFNISNALAAAACALGGNINFEAIKEGLEKVESLPGRLEHVKLGQSFDIIVDYAHTPDALKRVFEAVKPNVKGRIIHVAGATGNRDRSKRSILGALAGQYADIVIVTNEDPDNENPWDIIEAVAAGVPKGRGSGKKLVLNENFFKIADRAEAIEKALSLAKVNDLVLVTGKGDETSMVTEGKLVPYSDKEVIKEYFRNNQLKNKVTKEQRDEFWNK